MHEWGGAKAKWSPRKRPGGQTRRRSSRPALPNQASRVHEVIPSTILRSLVCLLKRLPRSQLGVRHFEPLIFACNSPQYSVNRVMSDLHPSAVSHLPWFITAPGETDYLLIGIGILLVAVFLGLGALYFKLHHLPGQLAQRKHYIQFEVVLVLSLLAMLTHNNAFWIAALLLALVPVPDFLTLFGGMAELLSRIAKRWTSPAIRLLRRQDGRHEIGEKAVPSGRPISIIKISDISKITDTSTDRRPNGNNGSSTTSDTRH